MNNKTKTFLAALGGAAVGAGIALLFAPASGKETRQKIADKTNETADKVKDTLHDKKEQLVEKGKEILSNMNA